MATSFTPKRLASGAVPTSQGQAYVVPANTATMIKSIDFCAKAASLTVTIWVVPSGQSVGDAYLYIYQAPVLNGLPLGKGDERLLILNAGDFIEWVASGTGVSGVISGAEEGLS